MTSLLNKYVLRIGNPWGESVLEFPTMRSAYRSFRQFAVTEYPVELRRLSDRVYGGWRGLPLRVSYPQPHPDRLIFDPVAG